MFSTSKHCKPFRNGSNRKIIAILLLFISGCGTKVLVPEAPSTLFLSDQVISRDVIWRGIIEIEGVVVIGRSATLIIEPGTRVRFKKIDTDANGTGDSELRILGRIIAEGRPDARIYFESAEVEPEPHDWSYLLVYTSGRLNRINHCLFRHAFSGLQVHFSTASVKNSIFRDNHEGLRFGRADLKVENSLFTSNDVGIRFTRMEGPVWLKDNEITANRIGIFLVPSGQNIRDFFEPDRSGRAWNTGRLKINGNNIFDNREYNLSLGEKQLWNLEIAGNYWGSIEPAEIEAGIYGHGRDGSLGRVFYQPFSPGKFAAAGPESSNEPK